MMDAGRFDYWVDRAIEVLKAQQGEGDD